MATYEQDIAVTPEAARRGDVVLTKILNKNMLVNKGDIIVGAGGDEKTLNNVAIANVVTLPVGGTNGQPLVVNSATNCGLQYGPLTANGLGVNAVYTGAIQNSAITTAKINANAVTTDKINAGAVGVTQLAANLPGTIIAKDSFVSRASLSIMNPSAAPVFEKATLTSWLSASTTHKIAKIPAALYSGSTLLPFLASVGWVYEDGTHYMRDGSFPFLYGYDSYANRQSRILVFAIDNGTRTVVAHMDVLLKVVVTQQDTDDNIEEAWLCGRITQQDMVTTPNDSQTVLMCATF